MASNLCPDSDRRNVRDHARLVINRDHKPTEAKASGSLTFSLVMAQARSGQLDPAIVAALLVGVGVCP